MWRLHQARRGMPLRGASPVNVSDGADAGEGDGRCPMVTGSAADRWRQERPIAGQHHGEPATHRGQPGGLTAARRGCHHIGRTTILPLLGRRIRLRRIRRGPPSPPSPPSWCAKYGLLCDYFKPPGLLLTALPAVSLATIFAVCEA